MLILRQILKKQLQNLQFFIRGKDFYLTNYFYASRFMYIYGILSLVKKSHSQFIEKFESFIDALIS